MELKVYLRLLVKKWWIVLPAFLVTLALTIVFTFSQAPVYQAVTRFVVRPNASSEDIRDFVSGLEVLSRRAEIASTYAEVAKSRLIKTLAAEDLGLSSGQRKSLSVESKLLAGTNVLEITVFGNEPVLVRDFADAVGYQTIVYVQGLYESYELTPLDRAIVPTSPSSPNKALNLGLGAVLGLALGAGLAFLSAYLQAPLEPATRPAILDRALGEAVAAQNGGEKEREARAAVADKQAMERSKRLVIFSLGGGAAAGWIVAGVLALQLTVGGSAEPVSGRALLASAVPTETPTATLESTASWTITPAVSPSFAVTASAIPTNTQSGTPRATPTPPPAILVWDLGVTNPPAVARQTFSFTFILKNEFDEEKTFAWLGVAVVVGEEEQLTLPVGDEGKEIGGGAEVKLTTLDGSLPAGRYRAYVSYLLEGEEQWDAALDTEIEFEVIEP